MSRGELIRLATLHALLAGALVDNNDNLQVAPSHPPQPFSTKRVLTKSHAHPVTNF